ncbi:MAG: hypothetical protein CM1200mP9_08340 [Gammaproteobacteria bacterium]|nr:MAG: hypothetical protein CM1200mP9_08340 [Gammaproteobacteria bacterium]
MFPGECQRVVGAPTLCWSGCSLWRSLWAFGNSVKQRIVGVCKMKSFLFLAAGLFAAMSFGDDVVKVHRLTVEESLAAIEVIK